MRTNRVTGVLTMSEGNETGQNSSVVVVVHDQVQQAWPEPTYLASSSSSPSGAVTENVRYSASKNDHYSKLI